MPKQVHFITDWSTSPSIALHTLIAEMQLCSVTGPLRRPDEDSHLADLVSSRAHNATTNHIAPTEPSKTRGSVKNWMAFDLDLVTASQ